MESKTTNERLGMVAPCGIDCGICELHLCRDDQSLYNQMVENGIPPEKLPCPGCRALEGKCPLKPMGCETWNCVRDNELEFCSGCTDFPCNRLQPTADRADELPHNLKVFNLCLIYQIGLKAFVECSAEIKKRYYFGKIQVGNGPQL